MKRWLALILILLLTGCGIAVESHQNGSMEMNPSTGDNAVSAVPSAETFHYQVEYLSMEDQIQDEDGTPLVHYSFQLPHLTVYLEDGTELIKSSSPAQKQALETATVFNDKFEQWMETVDIQTLVKSAKEDRAWMKESGLSDNWHTPYELEMVSSAFQQGNIISVSGVNYSFMGGAHPNTSYLSWNFDLERATFFDPKLLGEGAALTAAVSEEIIRQSNVEQEGSYIPGKYYWENAEDIIVDWSNYAVSFDEKGMTVVFSAYELAAYAAGPQEFFMSYDWMRPYLSKQGAELLGLE